jgi:hypothetical protein
MEKTKAAARRTLMPISMGIAQVEIPGVFIIKNIKEADRVGNRGAQNWAKWDLMERQVQFRRWLGTPARFDLL